MYKKLLAAIALLFIVSGTDCPANDSLADSWVAKISSDARDRWKKHQQRLTVKEAIKLKLNETIVIYVQIDKVGKITKTKLVESSGNKEYDAVALNTVAVGTMVVVPPKSLSCPVNVALTFKTRYKDPKQGQ
ncbi:MAG: energy transducer TonB [Candidatus Obscuribacterales bacterium]|nr:energy transducer TonB [Candidatus Obscuribacterales bacterium]